jgi:hypothetical protein
MAVDHERTQPEHQLGDGRLLLPCGDLKSGDVGGREQRMRHCGEVAVELVVLGLA